MKFQMKPGATRVKRKQVAVFQVNGEKVVVRTKRNRRARRMTLRIDAANEQIKNGQGYDHNWVLNRLTTTEMQRVARVYEPTSGRTLEVSTTEPGLQFYAGNFLDGKLVGKAGKPYGRRSGFCLETQHYPDTPNHANFPTTLLKPGQRYYTRTSFTFGVSK